MCLGVKTQLWLVVGDVVCNQKLEKLLVALSVSLALFIYSSTQTTNKVHN